MVSASTMGFPRRTGYCGLLPAVVMAVLLQHAAAGPNRCPIDPNSATPCAFSYMTSSMNAISYWSSIQFNNDVINTAAPPDIRTTTGCPVQGGHPRCPSNRMYMASACAASRSHTATTVINLGNVATFEGPLSLMVNGWYPGGKAECYYLNGIGGVNSCIAVNTWTPSGMVTGATMSMNSCCNGAFAVKIMGGGYCGDSRLATPLRVKMMKRPDPPVMQVDSCLEHPYRDKCL